MRPCILLLLLAAGVTVSATRADEVDELIETLRPSPSAPAVWAERLLEAAERVKDNPQAQARLYGAAYEQGLVGPEGYATAIAAARAMRTGRPEETAAWDQRLLDALQRDWQAADRARKKETGRAYVEGLVTVADGHRASGRASQAAPLYQEALYKARYYAPGRRDEIVAKLKDAREREAVLREVAQGARLLKTNPGNIPLRERLIRLHIVELGRPQAAAKLLADGVSEPLRTYVPLAAQALDRVAKDAGLELGDWYRSLAASATPRGKAHVLARAKVYYGRFVALEKDPVRRAIGEAKQAEVVRDLGKLGLRGLLGGKHLTLDLGGGVKMRLVRIPAGSFVMGSPASEEGRRANETPHEVTIKRPFYMGVTEVTRKQYAAVMGTAPGATEEPDRPVEQVPWSGAAAFCKTLAGRTAHPVRLPTEAEWEYACRAGSKTAFCCGDDEKRLPEYAWFRANSGSRAHPVAQRKPNAWGLYDMHGNLWEWCADWYDRRYYTTSPKTDPAGPASGTTRVFRGGGWSSLPGACRSASRTGGAPNDKLSYVGFRAVIPVGGE